MGQTPAPETISSADDVLDFLLAGIQDIPERDIPFGSVDIGSSEFRDYFTVRTVTTLDRYQRYVEPADRLADQLALARIGERWDLTPRPEDGAQFLCPTHEQPELLHALITEWLNRVHEHSSP